MKKKMLSAALLLALLCLCAAATAQTGSNTSTTAANEWQYSDVRKYLNNSVTAGQANSTTEECNSTNDSGYAAHFTDAEYALMKPTTVNTRKNINDPNAFVTTTDRIFLPSGRSENGRMNVLSWGTNDLAYRQEQDKTVLIPLGYWANGDDPRMWLRSAGTEPEKAMSYRRDNDAETSDLRGVAPKNVDDALGVAPVFRLNAEDILFASCASAAVLALETSQCMSTRIEGTNYLGKIDPTETTPSYGMYLKTEYEDEDIDFKVRNLSYSENEKELSFEYAGGMPGDYVMIQAYVQDDFDPSENSPVRGYVAAKLIENGHGEMSVDMKGNLMRNMANYTFKIWMENPSRVSLAQATVPQTFLFDGESFEEVDDDEDPHKNLRMFAMKGELNCSWGDLDKLDELSSDNFNNVVAGELVANGVDNDSWIKGKSCGVNASNQIIYFGVESYFETDRGVVSKPLRFWIAGHDHDEDKLTLYQMSSDETHVFRGNGPYSPGNGLEFTTQINPEQNSLQKGSKLNVNLPANQSYRLVSTNPHVATVDQIGNVTVKDYGEFSIVLFSGNQILQTETIHVINSNLPEYIPAGEWRDDETEEDEEQPEQQPEQPEQPEEAVQDAADGLPQTGDSSVLPLWAALLALSLAGLAARRRRSA